MPCSGEEKGGERRCKRPEGSAAVSQNGLPVGWSSGVTLCATLL